MDMIYYSLHTKMYGAQGKVLVNGPLFLTLKRNTHFCASHVSMPFTSSCKMETEYWLHWCVAVGGLLENQGVEIAGFVEVVVLLISNS